MKLYHRTYEAKAILSEGFKDGPDLYKTLAFGMSNGVWFSANNPLDANEGAEGDTLLVVDIPEDEIKDFEWIEEGKPYREFCIPAEIVNRYGVPDIFDEDE